MWFYSVIASAMAIAAIVSDATKSDLDGWYSCSDFTFSDAGSASNKSDAECAIYKAPLCYPGICETPENASPKKLDIFVKRLLATSGDPNTATNLWLVQGGSGASTTFFESFMVDLHQKLKGAVNVYTMDHRGLGRSSRLDCVAAQGTATGSPSGSFLTASEALSCAQDLQLQYSTFSSFSVTTVATDLASFMSRFTNKASTIVYGEGYATVIVERLIHLAPPEVTGYVLDGVATSSGAPVDKFFYVSKAGSDFSKVGDAFLAQCEKDAVCKSHFQSKTLKDTVQDLLVQFDKKPNSTCASIVSQIKEDRLDGLPSSALRYMLGSLLDSAFFRSFIPPVVYRLNRCAPKDIKVLKQFVDYWNGNFNADSPDNAFTSSVVGYLTVFSEMWEIPTPSNAKLKARNLATRLSDIPSYTMNPVYCAFSKEKSKSCEEFGVSNSSGKSILYPRDKYWNKSAKIPKQASVLLLSGKLDPDFPHKYAKYLFESLKGDNKELITFDSAGHGILVSTNMVADDPSSETCGARLLVSYVRNSGKLARLDKSCVAAMPAFSFKILPDLLSQSMGTDEAYDGKCKTQ